MNSEEDHRDPAPSGGRKDGAARKRPPNPVLFLLVIISAVVIFAMMAQQITGGDEVKEVSWGTFTSQLTTGFEVLTEERRLELKKGFLALSGIDPDAQSRMVSAMAGIPYENVTLQDQRDALKRDLEGIPRLEPQALAQAKEVVDQVVNAALQDLRAHRKVKRIRIEKGIVTAELNVEYKPEGSGPKGYKAIATYVSPEYLNDPAVRKRLEAATDDLRDEPPSILGELILPWLLPSLLFLAVAYFLFFRPLRSAAGPGSVLNFNRSRARLITPDHVKVSFDDVAGVDEAKQEVKELVEFLRHPKKFRRLGGRIPRGILLVGPPGTGKTLLAKAIAGESGVPFFSISGSDFVEMFVGVGAGRVRDLFRQAREQAPCVVFLDEIDAVGRRRGSGLGGGHDEREQTLNQILVEMDGFSTDENVIVLAATNRPDILDPALLRPGRFDREVVLDLPDVKGREAILRVHVKKIRLRAGTDLGVVARTTPGCSGADLANIVNEAAIIATMRNQEFVEVDDLEEARDKLMWGRQKKSKVMDEEEKKVTAYHEAGHALVAQLLHPVAEPVHKVTIIPRGMSLGSTMRLPEKERNIVQRNYFNATLSVLYGGRVAEETCFDDISHGARDDIKKATDIARAMVTEWGMSEEMGPVAYSDPQEHLFLGREITRTSQHSEETSRQIDSEVRRILQGAYDKAKELIEQNRDKLRGIAEGLLRYETLSGDEVARIIKGESLDKIRGGAAIQTA